MYCSSRKLNKDSEGNSEISRVTALVSIGHMASCWRPGSGAALQRPLVGTSLWKLEHGAAQSPGDAAPPRRAVENPEGRASGQKRIIFQTWSSRICLAKFWTDLGPVAHSFFAFSPFWNEDVSPMPSMLWYFRSTQLAWFYRFTAGQEFASGWIIPWVSPISDLDDV